ncbi:MAG: argininosuccinate lyase [Aeromicrobium sp.]|nr:argininosuccinate lyase [Burkholderiales bacterium]
MRLNSKLPLFLAMAFYVASALAQKATPRDQFFWLGEINKASAVINTDEGLLDKAKAPTIAAGIVKVLEDGAKPGAKRPFRVIEFEPLLISAAGQDVTLLHAGRSSQDMFATYRAAIMRDNLLNLADQLNQASESLVKLADEHAQTIVPNYTNGVAAQPNSLGHALLGHAAGFERDAQRIRQAYARIDRSPMGTSVLNGSSWPLNRLRMAEYLGFAAIVDNAYDAAQISSSEYPVEVAGIVTSVGLHIGHFIQDVLAQYGQTRPWILLQARGMNTRVSSAMPQKQNPILLTETRRDVSTALALAMGPVMRAHNITPGMQDPKEESSNTEMVQSAVQFLKSFERILNALVISPERALEELNSDWTASQELADVLMSKYKVPFRVGHHFAAEVVKHGKANNIKPLDFPYAGAKKIFLESVKEYSATLALPMSEQEFRSTLNPVAIVQNRRTVGGPQMSEMKRMLALAKQQLADQNQWINARRGAIENARTKLDKDFSKLLAP